MKPQHCKASKENDEWYCPWKGLRWGVSNEGYTPECQSDCLTTTQKCIESDSVRRHQQELRAEKFERDHSYLTIDEAFNMHTGESRGAAYSMRYRGGAKFIAELPEWAMEREASIIFFKDQILVAHPKHPLKVLHPGAKKFVDVSGIT